MPIAYRILRDPPLMLSSYYGVVTADEYLQAYRSMFTDSDYVAGMDELSDTRSMTAFDVQLPAIRTLAAWVAERVAESDTAMRTAVIQGSLLNSGVSKLYGAVADIHRKETLRLFPSVADAVEWLGLEPLVVPAVEHELSLLNKR